ncbi:MAG: alanine--tRNA ligase [Thermoleophilaceae bacterium]
MRGAELRETFLSFFESKGHLRVPSSSLVPPPEDRTVLLTTAGMQQFKPYFRGQQKPPSQRLTSCQKCFRTPDIEQVGITARHLTFFEMLGNFSVGDYFKQGAVEFAWEFSTEVMKLDPERIWVTVFGGDDDLGLGYDEEAVQCWLSIGVPEERIVHLGREDNFWQAGAVGPCGPCSELYYDRGPDYGPDTDRPGDDTERMLEYWNLVFMQYELHEDGSLTPLPSQNIDTGLGLERMSAILQDVPSVYETDLFRPIIDLGEELSGRRYGADFATTRALRILADHGRGATFMLADGVVPSNEDRGYVLRRIMRRMIQQGRVLGLGEPFLERVVERVIEVMGDAYPDIRAARDTIVRWAVAEEESFGRTLAQGERLLAEVIQSAKDAQTSWVDPEDAFRLHDTYGFPYELTKELLHDQGLSVDDAGFEELMERARAVSRGGWDSGKQGGDHHERVLKFAQRHDSPTRFVGYEAVEWETTIGALERDNGRFLAKLAESPFYAEGGGQVSDSGVVETPSGLASVAVVYRLPGEDQAVALDVKEGELVEGEPARALVDRPTRFATMNNHTATHLLHAALRAELGTHVRQAGSYVGPDKLRFDFTHSERLTPDQVTRVEERVNEWIVENHPVHAVYTSREEAERLGAMALFGEKYGDWVRMVEIEGVSRELCGGTHVANSAEIGLFHLTHETSSAANVRRVEAVTGAGGVDVFRERTEEMRRLSAMLRVPERDVVSAVEKLQEQLREAQRRPRQDDRQLAQELAQQAEEIGGVRVLAQVVDVPERDSLLQLSDQLKQTLGDSAVVLGTAIDGRVHLIANFSPGAVERGLKAGDVVRAAAEVAGGGGGGRDNMAQAGGRDPEKLPEAIAAARLAIEKTLR